MKGVGICVVKKPKPFGNLPVRKTFFEGNRLGIDFFYKMGAV